jgi:hypothetical protein
MASNRNTIWSEVIKFYHCQSKSVDKLAYVVSHYHSLIVRYPMSLILFHTGCDPMGPPANLKKAGIPVGSTKKQIRSREGGQR